MQTIQPRPYSQKSRLSGKKYCDFSCKNKLINIKKKTTEQQSNNGAE